MEGIEMPWTWKEHASTRIPNIDFLRDQMGFPSLYIVAKVICEGVWDGICGRSGKDKAINHAKVFTHYITTKLALLHFTLQASRL